DLTREDSHGQASNKWNHTSSHIRSHRLGCQKPARGPATRARWARRGKSITIAEVLRAGMTLGLAAALLGVGASTRARAQAPAAAPSRAPVAAPSQPPVAALPPPGYDEAQTLLGQKRYAEAAEKLRPVTAAHPDFATGW